MKTKHKYQVSESAIFASTLNHLTGVCLAKNEDERELFKKALGFTLSALIPKDTKEEKSEARASYVALLANAIGFDELEAKMLTLLNQNMNQENLKLLSELDFSTIGLNEDLIEAVTPAAITLMHLAGVEDLEAGYEELDNLRFAVEG